MPRSRWTRPEIQQLIDNYSNKTTVELEQMFPRHSRKSIERQIEKLRREGIIDYRNKRTIKRAYKQRFRKSKIGNDSGRYSFGDDYDYEDIGDDECDEYDEYAEDDYGYEEVDDEDE